MAEINGKKSSRIKNIAVTVVIIAVAALLIPVLILNLTLIIKGAVNEDVPPDIFGIAPLTVTTGSMSGEYKDSFDEGALVFIKVLGDEDKKSLKAGDIVCFKTSDIFVTHRIISVNADEEGNAVSVVTKGDANNASDGVIETRDIFGVCVGSAAGLGGFALFLQTPAGILVFVGIPVLLFIIYDVVRIILYNKRTKARTEATEAEEALRDRDEEIKRLRAELEERNGEKDRSRENADDAVD